MTESGFVGFVTKNSTLRAPFVTRNGSGVPSAPDATPTYEIYSGDYSGVLASGNLAAVSGAATGVYSIAAATTDGGYAAGSTYGGVVKWAVSSTNYSQAFTFSVV